ncbi:hypothetical protein SRABI128_04928 [Microbacterium sp. Bi128]|nr:hypothetical protein SRABI128_04928 [Microbacterium sp. Bi128]
MKVGRSNARTMVRPVAPSPKSRHLCPVAESQQATAAWAGPAKPIVDKIIAAPTAEAARDRVLFKFSPKIVPFA